MTDKRAQLSNQQLDDIRATLMAERARLERQISRKLGPVELDQTAVGRLSRMNALMNQGLAQGSELRAVEEFRLVEEALARLDAGTYGICHSCEQSIDVQRLLVLPETRTCAGCTT